VLPRYVDPEAEEETRRYARMTPEERLELFEQLCELTHEILRDRPDADAIRAPVPRSQAAIETWQRLMRRS
jgi:hypothetical protein